MTDDTVEAFLDRYAAALLARDAKAIAKMYTVPSLIVFPGTMIAVSDARQTEEFFASAWGQYDGIDTLDKRVHVMGEAPHSLWAEVTWLLDGAPKEHVCYQLVTGPQGYQIAVLTPLA